MRATAFIGTRDLKALPAEWVELYRLAVKHVVLLHQDIVTGAAVGADQLAAVTCLELGGQVHLKLPWSTYEAGWVSEMKARFPGQVHLEVYDVQQHPAWAVSVSQYHPAPGNLSRGAFALHARNYGILEAIQNVVALPSTKPGGSGTGQGLRIGRALEKRVFDLSQETHRQQMERITAHLRSEESK
jgi:hypothetical protein